MITIMQKTLYILVSALLFLILPPSSLLSQCIEGDCQNGNGTYDYSTGVKYVGEWKDGRKHGQGVFFNADGKRYEGEWKKGMREGQGKIIDKNGVESQSGYWKNGSFKGEQKK